MEIWRPLKFCASGRGPAYPILGTALSKWSEKQEKKYTTVRESFISMSIIFKSLTNVDNLLYETFPKVFFYHGKCFSLTLVCVSLSITDYKKI